MQISPEGGGKFTGGCMKYDKKIYWIHNFWVLKDNNIQGKMINKTNIGKYSPFHLSENIKLPIKISY